MEQNKTVKQWQEVCQYRTTEQWLEICESAINGNWRQAGKECVLYGFWANDLINAFEEETNGLECTDLALLTEIAMEHRHKEE